MRACVSVVLCVGGVLFDARARAPLSARACGWRWGSSRQHYCIASLLRRNGLSRGVELRHGRRGTGRCCAGRCASKAAQAAAAAGGSPAHSMRADDAAHPTPLALCVDGAERCRSSLLLARSAVVMSRGLVCVPGRVAARGDASGMKLLSIEEKLHPAVAKGGEAGGLPLWRSPHPRLRRLAEKRPRNSLAARRRAVVRRGASARALTRRRPPPSRHPPSERRGCSRAASSSARPRRRLRCASPTLCSPCSPSQLSFCCQGFSPCLAGRDVASL